MKKIGKIAGLCLICFILGRISYAIEVSQPSWYHNVMNDIKKWNHTLIVETPVEARGSTLDESGQEFLKESDE